ncbi:MAG: pirin family protein [Actinobacteria bacterium]|jgi:redox-sensitive bicupin YhaK (pirin superfamily)|nr:pirin family protein [Actinomycetota bacterium]
MSGPVQQADQNCENEPLPGLEIREGRRTEVGGLPVSRVLPTKGRRDVGPWCFVDEMGPADAEEPDPMEVGPHPHIGLATVTWLLEGEALHSDSLGSEQMIRPGQLNLMYAGHGIAHAELAAKPPFRGVQMWLAQPEETRHGASSFEHHAELPHVEIAGDGGPRGAGCGQALVFAGRFAGAASPARADSPLIGAELTVSRGRTPLPLEAGFEHTVIPLDGRVLIGGEVVEPGSLALLPEGPEELVVEAATDATRFLLLGGEPLGVRLEMFWNFVARDRDEIAEAWRAWQANDTDRFPTVPSTLARIDAPRPPWMTRD